MYASVTAPILEIAVENSQLQLTPSTCFISVVTINSNILSLVGYLASVVMTLLLVVLGVCLTLSVYTSMQRIWHCMY